MSKDSSNKECAEAAKDASQMDDRKKLRVEHQNRVAIIIPFRDLDPRQTRKAQLETFAPYMRSFLDNNDDTIASFKIFVVEQSSDGRKFNRGKLLNIGFKLAEKEGFETFIFHDVDLLPSDILKRWYLQKPEIGTVAHIARCWSRYNGSKTYLGGIVAFRYEEFVLIDGFPNTYWGWGGEDDELSKRVRESRLRIDGPPRDLPEAIKDMEQMSLQEKLEWLRANRNVKCDIKWEVNDEHDLYRRSKEKPKWWGLKGLKEGETFKVLSRADDKFAQCSIFTVDVMTNLNDDGTEHLTPIKKS